MTRSGTRSAPVPRTPRTSYNVDLKYSNNEHGSRTGDAGAERHRQQGDGIAVTLSNADAVDPGSQEGRRRGDPRSSCSTRASTSSSRPASKMYFGSDEDLAGQTIGTKITEAGGGKALCVIQAQGSVALETRCAGVKKTFTNTENIQVNGRRPAAGAGRPSAPSCSRTRRSRTSSRSARRSPWPRCRRRAPAARQRSSLSTSTRTPPRRSRTVRSSSRSTSSPTCRATWRSTGAVAEPDQRQRHRVAASRCSPARPSSTRPTSPKSCPTRRTTSASPLRGEPAAPAPPASPAEPMEQP